MAIQRTHKKSDLEKRLKVLNQQLYGKQTDNQSTKVTVSRENTSPTQGMSFSLPSSKTTYPSAVSIARNDVSYLRRDLTKITILATAAMGAQFLLYFLIQEKIISLSFLNLHF